MQRLGMKRDGVPFCAEGGAGLHAGSGALAGGSGSMPPNSLAGSNAVAGAAAGPCVGTLGVMIVSSIIGGTAV